MKNHGLVWAGNIIGWWPIWQSGPWPCWPGPDENQSAECHNTPLCSAKIFCRLDEVQSKITFCPKNFLHKSIVDCSLMVNGKWSIVLCLSMLITWTKMRTKSRTFTLQVQRFTQSSNWLKRNKPIQGLAHSPLQSGSIAAILAMLRHFTSQTQCVRSNNKWTKLSPLVITGSLETLRCKHSMKLHMCGCMVTKSLRLAKVGLSSWMEDGNPIQLSLGSMLFSLSMACLVSVSSKRILIGLWECRMEAASHSSHQCDWPEPVDWLAHTRLIFAPFGPILATWQTTLTSLRSNNRAKNLWTNLPLLTVSPKQFTVVVMKPKTTIFKLFTIFSTVTDYVGWNSRHARWNLWHAGNTWRADSWGRRKIRRWSSHQI